MYCQAKKNFGVIRKFLKIFRITPKFFFCFTIHKKLNKSCSLKKKILFLKKKILSLKKNLKKKFVSGTHRGGFQCTWILTPQGVTFHPVVVIGLGKNLLFKSVLAHCDLPMCPIIKLKLKLINEKKTEECNNVFLAFFCDLLLLKKRAVVNRLIEIKLSIFSRCVEFKLLNKQPNL